jgi:malonyl CoA-acyl carrier protein transacylase
MRGATSECAQPVEAVNFNDPKQIVIAGAKVAVKKARIAGPLA